MGEPHVRIGYAFGTRTRLNDEGFATVVDALERLGFDSLWLSERIGGDAPDPLVGMALPTERTARIALRTQQVIAHETNVAHVADPLGGSWYVEHLTDEVERQAEELFSYLDEIGGGSMLEGVIKGIEDNWFQGRIADSAYDLERRFNTGRRIVVGVNAFTEGSEEEQIPLLQITNEDETRQLKRLEQVRHSRDQAAVDAALGRVRTEAADPEINLMTDRATDAAMWASVADTLRRKVLPQLTDAEARASTIQLIAMAIYAGRRGNDPQRRRLDELSNVLGASAGQDVLRSCIAVLADPYHRAHAPLRELLEEHLDDDLAGEVVLLKALENLLPDG